MGKDNKENVFCANRYFTILGMIYVPFLIHGKDFDIPKTPDVIFASPPPMKQLLPVKKPTLPI